MSLRSGTQKAKKFGTPTTPTSTAPKSPSPRTSTPTSPSTTTGTQKAKPTGTRKQITPTEAGKTAQENFKTQLQRLTAPIRNQIASLTQTQKTLAHEASFSTVDLYRTTRVKEIEKEKEVLEQTIRTIEQEEHDKIIKNNADEIIQELKSGNFVFPDWFNNNIAWMETGTITPQEFLDSYSYLSNQGTIHARLEEPIIEEPIIEEPIIEEPIIELPVLLPEVSAEPEINDSITTNMVTQQVINFNIINGRAVGSIKFIATENFNPYYYGQNIINIVQFKTPNGVSILPYVKQNNLTFTETERDEIIHFDEDMNGNTRATVESFVWEWIDKPAGAFSNMYSIEISEKEPPKPLTTGFMGAGVAGAIAGLILIGFIADYKRGK